uniref:C2H2-type domain-containing protein n=1 Tax=Globodera pallida TaxID=36090 RepID=A0A183C6C8_GLOPA
MRSFAPAVQFVRPVAQPQQLPEQPDGTVQIRVPTLAEQGQIAERYGLLAVDDEAEEEEDGDEDNANGQQKRILDAANVPLAKGVSSKRYRLLMVGEEDEEEEELRSQVRRHEGRVHGESALECTVFGCEVRVAYNRLARHIRDCHSDVLKSIDSSTSSSPLTEEARTDELAVLGQKYQRLEDMNNKEEGEEENGTKLVSPKGGKENKPATTASALPPFSTSSPPQAAQSVQPPPPSSSSSLSSSVGIVPTAELALGQHECAKCGQRKATRETLRRHIARVHDKRYTEPKREKRHRCEWPGCEKSFTTQGRLEDHVNGHTGKCPFNCEHCNRNFAARAEFVRHLRKYHATSIRQMSRQIEQLVDLTTEPADI